MERAQITVEDFDNAVKQPWSGTTCVVAQHMKRVGLPVTNVLSYAFYRGVERVRIQFDRYFRKPGDEKKPELQALRASLPTTLTESGVPA